MLLQAQDLIKGGQATEAGGLLERLADRSDLSPIQRFQLAALLGHAQRYKRAIGVFSSLPTDYPDPYSRGYGLALAYFADGQYVMCIKSLKGLESRGFIKPELFSLLGLALARSGETLKGYEAFEKGIRANPRNPRTYLAYGMISVEHLEYRRAVDVLTSALQQIPGDYRLFLARGAAATLLGELDKAQADCERAMGLDPTDSRVYLVLGLTYIGQIRYDEAAQVFRDGIARGLNDKQLQYFFADVLLRKGLTPDSAHSRQALAATNSCLTIDPSFAYCYLDRARLELLAGQLGQAVSDLERARSLAPESRSVLYHLAVAYQKAGREAEAQELLARVKGLTIREFQIYRTMLLVDVLSSLSSGTS